jgi:glycosyltransferase involved in cell wall biosynthesis
MYLKQTLDSLIPFSKNVAEIIIVDGQSTDSTLSIINSHEVNETFKVLLLSSQPLGVAHAMNLGASHAKSEYIAFLNSDDYWNYTPLVDDLFKEIFEAHKYDLYFFSCVYLQNGNEKTRSVRLSKRIDLDLFLRNRIYHPSTIIRNSYFVRIGGFDLGFPTAFDYDFWLRASKSAIVLTIPLALATFRVHDESLSFKFRGKATREVLNIRVKNSSDFKYYALSIVLYFRDVLFLRLFEVKRFLIRD